MQAIAAWVTKMQMYQRSEPKRTDYTLLFDDVGLPSNITERSAMKQHL
jgi:hypothetical protein